MGLIADIDRFRFAAAASVERAWRHPADALAGVADRAGVLAFMSDGSARARWSYLLADPVASLTVRAGDLADPFTAAAGLVGPPSASLVDAPPFQGGLAGLFAYEAGLRREPSIAAGRSADWPDMEAGLYPALIAFDHHARRVVALGRGASEAEASRRMSAALAWLDDRAPHPAPARLAERLEPLGGGPAYRAAVAEVVERIAAGEIFQANIARAWGGRLADGAAPLDLFLALARTSPAPMAAYLRLRERAVVSNSPERFVSVDAFGRVETRPIKGTRPRGIDAGDDARLAAELVASAKDRAENLMIVDLMRNDLARACTPGTVEAPERFALESFANVHHLVSTVRGRLAPGRSAFELIGGAFPPGSVTGAPKVQAMRVIADLEPPRGPYCGSIFWAGFDGAFDSSVLIRTAALVEEEGRWRFEARAGAGITADSDPAAEDAEAEAKIVALARALYGVGMIPADDRGFALGDGLFETVLVRAGRPVLWDVHMGRLMRGCAALDLPEPDADKCRAAGLKAVEEAGLSDARAALRLSWSAGSGGRGLDRPDAPVPRLSVLAAPAPAPTRAAALVTVSVRRNQGSPASRLKSLSYLDNVLARTEARRAGADEALMLNGAGEVAGAAAANLIWIEDGRILTPSLACGVLDGTIRGALIERAPAAGLIVEAVQEPGEALERVEAMALTNSLIGLRPVAELDGRMLAPHPLMRTLVALIGDLV